MVSIDKDLKSYALETLREYIVYNNIEITSKEDLIKAYVVMQEKGYFFDANIRKVMSDVRKVLNDFANAYTKDKDILEKDLVFFGARRVLEKMYPKKR